MHRRLVVGHGHACSIGSAWWQSGFRASADNPDVHNVEPEILTPAGRRWVERAQRPLDVLAVVFLIDVILIWSFPDGPDRPHF